MKQILTLLSLAVVLSGLAGCASTDGTPGWNIPDAMMFRNALDKVADAMIKAQCETTIKLGLDTARQSSGDNSYAVDEIRACLKEAGIPLEQAGTSEEELAKLLVEGYKAEAKVWLGYARNSSSDNSFNVFGVRDYAAKAGVTLAEIGTSEEELATLLTEGYKAEARKWLEFARKASDEASRITCVKYIRKYLDKADHATPADIDSSEVELNTLGTTAASRKKYI